MAQVLSDGGGQLGCVDDARPDVVRLDPGGVWATPRSASPSIFTPTSLQRSPERQPTPLAASSSGRDRPDRKAPAQLGGRWSENAHLVGPSSVTPPPEIGSDFERSKMPVCVPERTVARGAWAVRYWRGDRQRCFGGVVVWEYPESSVWGKAMCPGFAAECRILPVLAQRRPDKVLEPRRVDSDRGLLLLPDGGPTIDTALDTVAWTDFIVGYAGLQQDLRATVVGSGLRRPSAAFSGPTFGTAHGERSRRSSTASHRLARRGRR